MRSIFALLGVLIYASASVAVPITFTHEGSGTGTLGGAAFGNTAFVITAQADTANRQAFASDIFFIDHSSAQIALTGLGTFSFTSPTRTFVNQGVEIVGFSRGGGGSDLFYGPPETAAFASWNMLSSIGPISGNGNLLQWTNQTVTTSGGTLVFDSGPSPWTFTARVLPEPGACVLALLAAACWCFRFLNPRTARR